ncbi:MAG: hypothetical protein DDT19_00030 [Syntrophomonadaceae bacterium]|nr:hypothetical protein [Bacillota bacterium]
MAKVNFTYISVFLCLVLISGGCNTLKEKQEEFITQNAKDKEVMAWLVASEDDMKIILKREVCEKPFSKYVLYIGDRPSKIVGWTNVDVELLKTGSHRLKDNGKALTYLSLDGTKTQFGYCGGKEEGIGKLIPAVHFPSEVQPDRRFLPKEADALKINTDGKVAYKFREDISDSAKLLLFININKRKGGTKFIVIAEFETTGELMEILRKEKYKVGDERDNLAVLRKGKKFVLIKAVQKDGAERWSR